MAAPDTRAALHDPVRDPLPSSEPAGALDPAETAGLLSEASADPDHLEDVRRRCIELNMPLARRLASRYAGRGVNRDDLEQVAYIGLVKAVTGYDPERGDDFLGYAVPTIRGELRRHFRDAGWVVRPPRRLQELQARVWAAETELVQRLHRSPTVPEIAADLGVDEEAVIEVLGINGCFAPTSLEAPLRPEGDGAVADLLGDEDHGFERTEAVMVVDDALECLSDRDRRIVELRFFEGCTQQEIGQRIGVTQMQVSRLLKRIVADLRGVVEGAPA